MWRSVCNDDYEITKMATLLISIFLLECNNGFTIEHAATGNFLHSASDRSVVLSTKVSSKDKRALWFFDYRTHSIHSMVF